MLTASLIFQALACAAAYYAGTLHHKVFNRK